MAQINTYFFFEHESNVFGTRIDTYKHGFFFEHEFTVRMVGFEHESHEFHEYFFAHR